MVVSILILWARIRPCSRVFSFWGTSFILCPACWPRKQGCAVQYLFLCHYIYKFPIPTREGQITHFVRENLFLPTHMPHQYYLLSYLVYFLQPRRSVMIMRWRKRTQQQATEKTRRDAKLQRLPHLNTLFRRQQRRTKCTHSSKWLLVPSCY
jgi:hypothetical protein